MLDKKWQDTLSLIDFAFQPIVNIHTGVTFGVEALLRGWQMAGFTSIRNLFDQAYWEGVLFPVDELLREKAIHKFLTIPHQENLKLFFNLDNRLIYTSDFKIGATRDTLNNLDIDPSRLCFEISEQDRWEQEEDMVKLLNTYRNETFRIALDDYGAGFAGLQMLYNSEPDYVKMDRFFIDGICKDARKKLFVSNSVSLAHTLGIQVVAEGVETSSEYFACSDIGCDYLQGYLVAYPTLNVDEILPVYNNIRALHTKNRRRGNSDIQLIREQIRWIEPISYPENSVTEIFDFFRRYNSESYIPLLNKCREPLGIIHERDLKEYVYSPFGRELLQNRSHRKSPIDFLQKVPSVEINATIEKILEVYSVDGFGAECVCITENGKYRGVLTAKTLLTALNEKNIAIARDLNPLSKLPGNNLITEFINSEVLNRESERSFVYFDIDNFKPFNDVYGFRTGDRVIQIFADILNQLKQDNGFFVGHIGGDDFFVGVRGNSFENVKERVQSAQAMFADTVKNIYSDTHRQEGIIRAKDRFGIERDFTLMTISAAMVTMESGTILNGSEILHRKMAELKKEAKEAPLKFANATIQKLEKVMKLCV